MQTDCNRKALTVAVIDDQPQIREGLGILINGTPGFSASSHAVDGKKRWCNSLRVWLTSP